MKQEQIPVPSSMRDPVETAWPVHDAKALTGKNRKAILLLNGQPYTLHITRQGKLLLTK